MLVLDGVLALAPSTLVENGHRRNTCYDAIGLCSIAAILTLLWVCN